VVHEDDDDIYVVETERRFAYVSELFVTEEARGTGAGKALLDACEAWARGRGMTVMQIGVLPANVRAEAVYRRAGYDSYAMQMRKYLR
jgi:GNAT superfamily N-acetyltransferase